MAMCRLTPSCKLFDLNQPISLLLHLICHQCGENRNSVKFELDTHIHTLTQTRLGCSLYEACQSIIWGFVNKLGILHSRPKLPWFLIIWPAKFIHFTMVTWSHTLRRLTQHASQPVPASPSLTGNSQAEWKQTWRTISMQQCNSNCWNTLEP